MGIIFKLVPWWAYIGLALFLWGAWGHYQENRYAAERAETAAETQRIINRVESQKAMANQQVSDNYAQKLKSVDSANAVLHAANVRLQQSVRDIGSTTQSTPASCTANGERAELRGQLLQECSGLAEQGAETARRLGAKVAALQEYAASVCMTK